MIFYQRFVTTFAAKKMFLIIAAGFLALTSMAQDRANFGGEWKLNESKSELGQFPLCIFGNDRMRSKSMKISAHADFLTVDVENRHPQGAMISRQDKLIFDKEIATTYVGFPRETSAARWSADGQTMTVHSVRSFDTNGETPDFRVTEVWKLINDGNSISIEVTSRSASNEDHTMKLLYDKQ